MINRLSEKVDYLSRYVKFSELKQPDKTEEIPLSGQNSASGPWENNMPTHVVAKHSKEEASELIFSSVSLEKLFLGNLFSKIGAVALIIGVGIFVRLISPYLHVSPAVRITLGYVAGVAVFLFGRYLYQKEDKFKNYAEVLFGTGIGIFFVVTFCAVGLYRLFSVTTALTAANLILAAAFFISARYRSFASFAVALAGCYLSPCFMGDFYSMDVLFIYVLFVNLISTAYVWRNPQSILLNIVNLIVSLLLLVHLGSRAAETYSVYMPLLFWSLYAFADFFALHRTENKEDLGIVYFTVFLNFAVFVYLLDFIHLDWRTIGNYALYPLVVYGGFGVLPKPEKLRFFINPFLLSLAFCTFCFFSNADLVSVWSFEGFLIILASVKLKQPKLALWGAAFSSLSLGYVFSLNETFGFSAEPLPLFINIRAVLLLLPAILNLMAAAILDRHKSKAPLMVIHTFRLYAWLALYLYSGVELNQYLRSCIGQGTAHITFWNFPQLMLYTTLGMVFAAHSGRLFRLSGYKPFIIVSAPAYIVSLTVLVFVGYEFRPLSLFWPLANMRLPAFVAAIVCTICYRRWSGSTVFTYLAVLLGFLFANYELDDTLRKFAWTAHETVSTSVMWLVFAGCLIFAGICRRVSSFKNMGILIVIVALAKILFFDLRHIEALYKVIAFMVLGIILLSVSYFYARRSKE